MAPGSRHASTSTISSLSQQGSADRRLPWTIRGSQSMFAAAGHAGDHVLMVTQEVTPESFQMMQRSPWWGRYMSSPTLEQQSYDTVLLYNKRQVSTAGSFERHYFRNSRMGAINLCTTFLLSHRISIVGLPCVSSMAQTPCPEEMHTASTA